LQKAGERKAQNRIMVEGFREIKQAVDAGFTGDQLFICPDYITFGQQLELLNPLFEQRFETTSEVFKKIAYRETSDGLLAIFIQKKYTSGNKIKFKSINHYTRIGRETW